MISVLERQRKQTSFETRFLVRVVYRFGEARHGNLCEKNQFLKKSLEAFSFFCYAFFDGHSVARLSTGETYN